MGNRYFKRAFLAAGLFYAGTAHAVGLGVAVFGGYAFPTGDMAAEEGFDLRPGGVIGGELQIGIHPNVEVDLGASYEINYAARRTKEYYPWTRNTTAFPIKCGTKFKTGLGNVSLFVSGGAGYYFLKTKVFSWIENYEDSGFQGWAYPVKVNLFGPLLYTALGATYPFGKFALTLMPRFNYVFNCGTHEGTLEETVGGVTIKREVPVNKNWNDAYFELTAGVVYTLF
jgi:hypothetical protein